MSMMWTENYLRTTGNLDDIAYADEIARMRGTDVPLPGELTKGIGHMVMEGGALTLAETGDATLDKHTGAVTLEVERLQDFREEVASITRPYSILFGNLTPEGSAIIRRGTTRWTYEKAEGGTEYEYLYALHYDSPGLQRRSHPTKLIMEMATQHDTVESFYSRQCDFLQVKDKPTWQGWRRVMDSPWLRLDFKDGDISSVVLRWWANLPHAVNMQLGATPAGNLVRNLLPTEGKIEAGYNAGGELRCDFTEADIVLQVKNVLKPDFERHGEATSRFIYSPENDQLERYSTNLKLESAAGVAEQIGQTLTKEQYRTVLQGLLSLIPTRSG